MSARLKIGELAKQTACPIETIRFYELERLLPMPARSEGNFRLYNEMHVERLLFIRHCRSLDMTLDEIRSLLSFRDAPEKNCAEVNVLLDKHIEHVARRIEELNALQKHLTELRSSCLTAHAAKDCGILQGLSTQEGVPAVKDGSHVGSCHSSLLSKPITH